MAIQGYKGRNLTNRRRATRRVTPSAGQTPAVKKTPTAKQTPVVQQASPIKQTQMTGREMRSARREEAYAQGLISKDQLDELRIYRGKSGTTEVVRRYTPEQKRELAGIQAKGEGGVIATEEATRRATRGAATQAAVGAEQDVATMETPEARESRAGGLIAQSEAARGASSAAAAESALKESITGDALYSAARLRKAISEAETPTIDPATLKAVADIYQPDPLSPQPERVSGALRGLGGDYPRVAPPVPLRVLTKGETGMEVGERRLAASGVEVEWDGRGWRAVRSRGRGTRGTRPLTRQR